MKQISALLFMILVLFVQVSLAEEFRMTDAKIDCRPDKSCDITVEVYSKVGEANKAVEYVCDIAIDYSLLSSPVSRTDVLTRGYRFLNKSGVATDKQTFNWRPLGYPLDLRRAKLGRVECKVLNP